MLSGIKISYAGDPHGLLFSGGIQDDQLGYSASLPIAAPETMDAAVSGDTLIAPTCAVASAGLMVGKPDPMEGFPSTVMFSMFGFARNAGAVPLTRHVLINYMDKFGPHNLALPDQTLQLLQI